MYNRNRIRVAFIAASFLALILFSVFRGEIEKRREWETTTEGKVEALGTEEFRFLLCSTVYSDDGSKDISIEWWLNEEDGTYYLFLPSAVSGKFSCLFNMYRTIRIDGIEIVPGEELSLLPGTHVLSKEDGKEIEFKVMQSDNLPSLFISTKTGSLKKLRESRNYVLKGEYVLLDSIGEINCSGSLEQIRGRGNFSYEDYDKKPFAIKMTEKTEVLGMTPSRKWTLLANASDETLIRNQIVMEMGKRVGMAFVPDMRFVDLYIDGEYQGNYQIAERVEIADGRIVIHDLEKDMEDVNPNVNFSELEQIEKSDETFSSLKWVDIKNIPLDSKAGYLLELDLGYRYDGEACGFVTSGNQSVVVQEPQYVARPQLMYLAEMYQNMEDALKSDTGYNEKTGLYYYDYIDIESFAQKYLIEEISKNLDANFTSFFMYIPEDNLKLHAGPIWDYDRTFGCPFKRGGIDLEDPQGFYASENVNFDEADENLLYLLCLQEEFQDAYKNLYFGKMRDVMKDIAENFVDENYSCIENSAMMNAVRWDSLEAGTDVENNRLAFRLENDSVISFIKERLLFLDEAWR